jgi:capsular exopolysaccharide synthesis family protein
MQDLNTALTHTRTRHQELSARYAELAKVKSDNPDELPASELLANNYLQALRTQYRDAIKERDAVVADGKGENHPLYQKANGRLIETRAALLREVRNIQGAVERDLAIIVRQEGGEAGLFDSARRRAVDLNMKEIEYHRLDRTREQNEKLYAMLLERVKEADLARMMKVNNIRVVDTANEPRGPIRPRVSSNVSMGLLLGLVLGIALAWLREQLDSSVKTPDELEQKLGVTFLGLLPEQSDDGEKKRTGKKRRRPTARRPDGTKSPIELTVHDHPLSGIAEAARSIRTNLMFMNPDRPYRKILVSSAAPSEGKTTVACSIAIAFAQGGQRVCIVDCDLRRPRLHRIFGRAGDAGVTNVLVGDATIDDVAKPTVVDNLWSIPAGPTPPNPADMLHSERFKAFLRELGERFDRVIIDSPPLVAVTDSAIISTYVDGSVFVVRAFKTSKHLSKQGLRALRDVDAPVVGAVLNAVNLNRSEYQYYHYYYYKKEGYAPTEERESENEVGAASPPN